MAGPSQLPKSKLVETAADLIYRQGWNATGINQILGDAKVPKGSFYYYFQSKEDLGVAIVRHHSQELAECYRRTLLHESLNGRDAIISFLRERIEQQRNDEWRFGCPVGSFANEVAATAEKIAIACREVFVELLSALEVTIRRGQADGSISNIDRASDLAMLISCQMQGANLLAKTILNPEPLELAVRHIDTVLRVKPIDS